MKRKIYSLLAAVFYLLCQSSFAQTTETGMDIAPKKSKKMKGTFYLEWGYNQELYTRSTIHFVNTKTDNYDFTLHNAKAHDKPGGDRGYLLNKPLTVPQYNFHIGYLFNDKRNWGVELSWDHLKYIVDDNQVLHVTGQIRGHAIDKDTLVTPTFVHLQHTNGNNYLMGNLVKKSSIFKRRKFELSGISKVGVGPMVSYSISDVLASINNGHFRIDGFVIGLSSGLRADFFRYFFVQATSQGALAEYLSTELGADEVGRAKHHFFSLAGSVTIGANFPLAKQK